MLRYDPLFSFICGLCRETFLTTSGAISTRSIFRTAIVFAAALLFLAPPLRAAEPLRLAMPVLEGAQLRMEWSGGAGPFQLQEAASPNGPWLNFSTPIDGTNTAID